jgi:chorismate mutase
MSRGVRFRAVRGTVAEQVAAAKHDAQLLADALSWDDPDAASLTIAIQRAEQIAGMLRAVRARVRAGSDSEQ